MSSSGGRRPHPDYGAIPSGSMRVAENGSNLAPLIIIVLFLLILTYAFIGTPPAEETHDCACDNSPQAAHG